MFRFVVNRISYIEIYNEKIYDLFESRNELKIQEIDDAVTVNAKEKFVTNEGEIYLWIQKGNESRKVAETTMNAHSSRSHTVFTIVSTVLPLYIILIHAELKVPFFFRLQIVEASEAQEEDGEQKFIGKLHLVDFGRVGEG